MITRKINPDELKRTDEIFNIAFEFDMSSDVKDKTPMEYYHEVSSRNGSRFDTYCLEKWAAFEDDGKTMMGYISALPFDVKFDGGDCKMAGIGGVATLPQYRRSGGIRGCFTAWLKDAYANGVDFGYLYPFSTAYYRKFGFELGAEFLRYEINLKSYGRFDVGGFCRLSEPNKTLKDDIVKVYESFAMRHNMAVIRQESDYRISSSPATKNEYTYVYYNRQNQPKGYMTFSKQREGAIFDMVCSDFFFVDKEGLKGLLNHALSFASYYEHICFMLPITTDITPVISEWALYPSVVKRWVRGMARVINVEKILKSAKYIGDGNLKIGVTDSIIQENDGVFELTFSSGKAVSVVKTDKTPDILLTIGDFSRMILGCVSDSEFSDGVEIFGDKALIEKVFYPKPFFIWDNF